MLFSVDQILTVQKIFMMRGQASGALVFVIARKTVAKSRNYFSQEEGEEEIRLSRTSEP